jgi:hypothetical protein
MLDVQRMDPLLWAWTSPHPQWTEDNDGWERDVRSVYAERPDAIVLVDPLVPLDPLDAERFYAALDRDLERRRVPVSIVCTVAYHRRSCGLLRERYDGSLYAPTAIRQGVEGATIVTSETAIADGVVLHPLGAPDVDEIAVRIHGATPMLVLGDVVVGRQGGDPGAGDALAVSPLDWFEPGAEPWYRQELPLLLERLADGLVAVVPSHGAVVTEGGDDALRAAVARLRASSDRGRQRADG